MPTLLISVSLCAAFAEGQSEARDYIKEMGLRTDFSPNGILLVGGAIKFSKYHEYEAQVIKLIGLHLRKRDDVDNDRVFTDWIKLESDIKKFATEWWFHHAYGAGISLNFCMIMHYILLSEAREAIDVEMTHKYFWKRKWFR